MTRDDFIHRLRSTLATEYSIVVESYHAIWLDIRPDRRKRLFHGLVRINVDVRETDHLRQECQCIVGKNAAMNLATCANSPEQVSNGVFISVRVLTAGIERVELGIMFCDPTECVEQMRGFAWRRMGHQGCGGSAPYTDFHNFTRDVSGLSRQTIKLVAAVDIHHRAVLDDFESRSECFVIEPGRIGGEWNDLRVAAPLFQRFKTGLSHSVEQVSSFCAQYAQKIWRSVVHEVLYLIRNSIISTSSTGIASLFATSIRSGK